MAFIMICDDDEDLVSAMAKALREAGHEVEVSLDTASAEKRMTAKRPDLLVQDVMFPGDRTAGFSFARKLRHFNEQFKGLPVLMLSSVNKEFPYGFSSRDIDEDWLPVSRFLDKPIELDVLVKNVNELLKEAEEKRSADEESK